MTHRTSLSLVCLVALLLASALSRAQPQTPPADASAPPPPFSPPPDAGTPPSDAGTPPSTSPPAGPPAMTPGSPPPQESALPRYPPPRPPEQPSVGERGRQVLVMPFLGFHSYQGDTGKGAGPGLRLGTLLGGYLTDRFSFNGELGVNVFNPDGVPQGVEVTSVSYDLALGPLVHLRTGGIELVAGPRVGFWFDRSEFKAPGFSGRSSARGTLFGLNAGLFAIVGARTAVGGLLNFDIQRAGRFCVKDGDMPERCGKATGDAAKVVGITAAALF